MGLATVLDLKAQGYFIPHRHADRLPAELAPYETAETAFAARRDAFAGLLDRVEPLAGELLALADGTPGAPRWDQDWFCRLDAAVAYALVRERRPRQIVEIGSGHSTRFLARAAAAAGAGARLIAIDPEPRASLAALAVDWRREIVQQAPLSLFRSLAAGDVVFIDSSHVLMPGSDVDHLFNRVLPVLSPGVAVHVHDIFLPDPYPAEWTWRGYNEQQAALLLLSGGYEPVFASRYVVTRLKERMQRSAVARLPLADGAYESSLWLEKR